MSSVKSELRSHLTCFAGFIIHHFMKCDISLCVRDAAESFTVCECTCSIVVIEKSEIL